MITPDRCAWCANPTGDPSLDAIRFYNQRGDLFTLHSDCSKELSFTLAGETGVLEALDFLSKALYRMDHTKLGSTREWWEILSGLLDDVDAALGVRKVKA